MEWISPFGKGYRIVDTLSFSHRLYTGSGHNLINVAKLRGQDIELANVVLCFFFLCLLSLSLFLFLVWEIFPQNFVLDNYSDRGTMHIPLLRMSSEAG